MTGFKTDSNKEYDKQSYTHFKDILERCSEDYDIPILITENSIGEDLNTLKINSLIDNIYQVNDSISKKNCKIFGYIYNSLTDFKVNNHSIKMDYMKLILNIMITSLEILLRFILI